MKISDRLSIAEAAFIIVSFSEGVVNIVGKNLVISKLLKDELLIEGVITSILIGDKNEK